MKFHTFDTGTLDVAMESIKMNTFAPEPLTIPIPWYVLDHPDALVVIDGGNPEVVATDPVSHWGDMALACGIDMAPESACLPTLRARGFDLDKRTVLVHTHLHGDHVGALAAFREFDDPTVFVSRREYQYALEPEWHMTDDYIEADYIADDIPWRFVEDDEDEFDLLGDGSVILHHTPGHTPGHMSVEVRLPETGCIILTGDAAYLDDHWREKAIPGLVASTVDAVRSVRKLRELAVRTNATVYYGHDLQQWLARGGAGVTFR